MQNRFGFDNDENGPSFIRVSERAGPAPPHRPALSGTRGGVGWRVGPRGGRVAFRPRASPRRDQAGTDHRFTSLTWRFSVRTGRRGVPSRRPGSDSAPWRTEPGAIAAARHRTRRTAPPGPTDPQRAPAIRESGAHVRVGERLSPLELVASGEGALGCGPARTVHCGGAGRVEEREIRNRAPPLPRPRERSRRGPVAASFGHRAQEQDAGCPSDLWRRVRRNGLGGVGKW